LHYTSIFNCIYILYAFLKKESFTTDESEEQEQEEQYHIDNYNLDQGKKLLADINTKLKILEIKKRNIDKREKELKLDIVKSRNIKDMQYEYTQKQNLIKNLKGNYKELLEDSYTLDDSNNDVGEIENTFAEKLSNDKAKSVGTGGVGFSGL